MPPQLANQLLDHKSVAHEIFKQAHVSSCKGKPDRAQRSEMDSTKQCCEGDMSIMNALASVAVPGNPNSDADISPPVVIV